MGFSKTGKGQVIGVVKEALEDQPTSGTSKSILEPEVKTETVPEEKK